MQLGRLALALLAAGVLAVACSDSEEEPAPTSTPTATVEATREATPAPTATPSPTAAPVAGLAMLLPAVQDLPPGAWVRRDANLAPADFSGVESAIESDTCFSGAAIDADPVAPQEALARVFTLDEADALITLAVTAVAYPTADDASVLGAGTAQAWADDARWATEGLECFYLEGMASLAQTPEAAAGIVVENVAATRETVEEQAWAAAVAADISIPAATAAEPELDFELRTDLFVAIQGRYAITILTSSVLSPDATPLLFDSNALLAVFQENVAQLP